MFAAVCPSTKKLSLYNVDIQLVPLAMPLLVANHIIRQIVFKAWHFKETWRCTYVANIIIIYHDEKS